MIYYIARSRAFILRTKAVHDSAWMIGPLCEVTALALPVLT